jgi:two-component system, chemotaxis family, protein-glutamate methylesterase/glutaminase
VLRVLVVDDSAVTREYLAQLLGADPDLQIVGTACDGEEAVALAEQLRPDVVVMDVIMPRMDGYLATRRIMERVPTPIVLVSASLDPDEVAVTFRAIQAGALAILEKPSGPGSPAYKAEAQRMIQTVKLMAEVRVIRRWPQRPARVSAGASGIVAPGKIRFIAIGGSTGGPQVVAEILSRLPATLPVPIAIVQHMTPGFSSGFVAWLNRESPLSVKLAEAGELAQPGVAYIAPDRVQLGITPHGRFRCVSQAIPGGFCPSVSFLFQSVTESYGSAAMGVLLTGMGTDGASELGQLRQAGGVTIVQDEESSTVFGMPGAAIKNGAAQHVLPPAQIADFIGSLAGADY